MQKITKSHFNIEYKKGPEAPFIDWVAGGNFDGYISEKSIEFIESNKQVIIKTIILDQSRYGGKISNSEILGEFEYTDKDTITIKYREIEMRGKILGSKKEFIVFDIFKPLMDFGINEVYNL